MTAFEIFKRRKIAIVLLDRSIRVMYNGHYTEMQTPYSRFTECREITDFEAVRQLIRQALKDILPASVFRFGNVEIYITCSPLAADIEKRAIVDACTLNLFRTKVHLVYFPLATAKGLQLCENAQNVIIELDECDCYISLIQNGSISIFGELRIILPSVAGMADDICKKLRIIFERCNKDIPVKLWMSGCNKDISAVHKLLQGLIEFPISIADQPNMATINGLKEIAKI